MTGDSNMAWFNNYKFRFEYILGDIDGFIEYRLADNIEKSFSINECNNLFREKFLIDCQNKFNTREIDELYLLKNQVIHCKRIFSDDDNNSISLCKLTIEELIKNLDEKLKALDNQYKKDNDKRYPPLREDRYNGCDNLKHNYYEYKRRSYHKRSMYHNVVNNALKIINNMISDEFDDQYD